MSADIVSANGANGHQIVDKSAEDSIMDEKVVNEGKIIFKRC
jgi:hypothetical protein